MFSRILIANRGEIACRIIRTARAMGVETVAVYSDADAGAMHVAMADHAVHIGGPRPAESYLRGEAIIAAAKATGAEAIHPGYGFLSENPDFVEAVEAAGLTFIGPSARAIRAMGLKDAAKRVMEEAGVPVVPGYHGAEQGEAHLAAEAEKIGYPALIKAVAGGGGKGMRRVEAPEDFATALASARAEAASAFGNDAVLIEKYVAHPRHIEVQVFGDGTKAVHLFERDCSLQRRHQKVIEEAPAPGMTEEVRAAMGAAAVRAAEAIGYKGAGTIEFIADGTGGLRPDGFWFMEMNTRLQVEHPVTEAITGIDLVEWQLRVAAGEPLPLGQDDLTISGHAFEARLYAEDVPAGFLPATGTLAVLDFAPAARADTGVRAGDAISPWYDPMIAKIIVHGPTRNIARARLVQALDQTRVAGTVTNLGFLGALARHGGFARGEVDTGLIARDLAALTEAHGGADLRGAMLGVAALAGAGITPAATAGFALWQPLEQTIVLEAQGGEVTVAFRLADGGKRADLRFDGHRFEAAWVDAGWQIAGQPRFETVRAAGEVFVFAPGVTLECRIIDPLDREAAAGEGGDVALSPMPGLVRAVLVRAGQAVAAGDRLAVLEAMKMEHALAAGRDGIVAEVLCAEGDQVEAGAALVRLEPEDEA